MTIGLPKLILIIVISIAILILLGIWIKGTFFKKEVEEGFPEGVPEQVPESIKERLIKDRSFISRSKGEIAEFLAGLYDESQNGFKMKKESAASLEATYYGLYIHKNLRVDLDKSISGEGVLEGVRSYYVSPGYYLEKEKDPVFSTMQVLLIDRQFPEDLEKTIDLDWLKSNSLENKNLEPEKFDPEYQSAVVEIYRHLEMPEKLEEISYSYFSYYCNFRPAENISDKEYLKEKYYQISLISGLSGAENIDSLTGNCFEKEDIEKDKERLSQIQLEGLDDIKEVYWLYYLEKFYNLSPDLKEIFKRLEKFYLAGGFKEKLTDLEPNLVGTYYGVLFIVE